MTGRIYLLDEHSSLLPLQEQPYDSESLLQELLAKHSDLLAGEQIDSNEPRSWLLVTREMPVPNEEEGSGRWSLDHLFLDQDAIPTLVEVKRSSNTQIRREVLGQMLDYAANAVAYWPVEDIWAKFEVQCKANGSDPEEELGNLLGEQHDTADFWQQVKTNLQAGRIRMVFIADEIPAELRQIVEFLNGQMGPAEVLAIEIKQFVGEGMKTLVPRVIGQTETARRKKQHFCGDKGYDFADVRGLVEAWGYTVHITSRGEEKKERRAIPGYRARRWVVERTHSWFNRFRRLLIRWEKKAKNYLAFLHFACAWVTFRGAQAFG